MAFFRLPIGSRLLAVVLLASMALGLVAPVVQAQTPGPRTLTELWQDAYRHGTVYTAWQAALQAAPTGDLVTAFLDALARDPAGADLAARLQALPDPAAALADLLAGPAMGAHDPPLPPHLLQVGSAGKMLPVERALWALGPPVAPTPTPLPTGTVEAADRSYRLAPRCPDTAVQPRGP